MFGLLPDAPTSALANGWRVFTDEPAGGISVAMITAPMPKGVWAESGRADGAYGGATVTVTVVVAVCPAASVMV